ncbi:ABC transporter ATP-binding protein [Chitinophaga sp. YIM B06452]|uniref:ABC transporter ATP-binding protein n=1 Tax=Chitinophaga sp. YIM B06452 TaxID=3082158 RepID=UPI0031FEB567
MFRKILRILDTGAHKLRSLIFVHFLCGVLQGIAFAVLVPLLRSILGGNLQNAWRWMLTELAILVVYSALSYWAKLAGLRISTDLCSLLWRRLGDHISILPLGWFSGGQVGQVAKLTSDGVLNVMGVSTNLLKPLMDAFVTPSVVVITIALFDWKLALAVAATVPFITAAYFIAERITHRFDDQWYAASVNMSGRIVEFAQAQPVLRAFNRTDNSVQLLDSALLQSRNATKKSLSMGSLGQILFLIVIQAAFTIVLFVGTYRALGSSIDAPELIALLILVTRFAQPLTDAGGLGVAARVARNLLGRMEKLMATPGLPETTSPGKVLNASIEFKNVSFGYDAGRTVLQDVSFKVQPNTVTALVGASGSGKTTITRLIGRFWDVNAGTVSVGGCDVRELSGRDLMAQVSFVFQDVYLFTGTIEENIRMAKPNATKEEFEYAIRAARVDEIIERLPEGLATQVGEGGGSLSGGERQRVSIARAILKDAPVILLDEATAALDAENEALVQEALSALSANRTLVIVAHRLQTIMAADQILVLGNGKILENGRHQDLLAKGGRYADFWREKERAKGWRVKANNIG